ncbi:hypothetical protein BH160DRAFT_1174 [Burkholderia sp. H160]|nr:hypothetical protein BH160DRAFT_1174 [Burkholderia sp. H160]
MALLNNGLKQSYYWPPYFNDENAFIRWFRLIQGLFYFVARGREPMAALEGMAALNDQYFNPPWTL